MDLKNGYKVMYDRIEGKERVFFASKTGAFEDAEEIVRVPLGTYKAVYEKDGVIYGSPSGTFEDVEEIKGFEKLFVVAAEEQPEEQPDEPQEPEQPEEPEQPQDPEVQEPEGEVTEGDGDSMLEE